MYSKFFLKNFLVKFNNSKGFSNLILYMYFFFEDVYLTYSDYVLYKIFLKKSNLTFFKYSLSIFNIEFLVPEEFIFDNHSYLVLIYSYDNFFKFFEKSFSSFENFYLVKMILGDYKFNIVNSKSKKFYINLQFEARLKFLFLKIKNIFIFREYFQLFLINYSLDKFLVGFFSILCYSIYFFFVYGNFKSIN